MFLNLLLILFENLEYIIHNASFYMPITFAIFLFKKSSKILLKDREIKVLIKTVSASSEFYQIWNDRVLKMRKAHQGWVMVTQRRMKQLARVMTRLCLETSPMCPPPHHSPSPFPAARCLTGALVILSSCTCTSVAELQKKNCTLCSNML